MRSLRRTRLWLLLGLVVLLVNGAMAPAYALKPTSAFYVNDYVGILGQDRAEYLVQRGYQLYKQNGVQVVAVVVHNYIGDSMAAYANQVFNEFGVGEKGKNTGVLLIVAVDDGEVRIEVGDGLSGQLPDSKAGTILDEFFMPAAAKGDLETAVYATYLALIREGSRIGGGGPPATTAPVNWLAVAAGVLLVLAGVLILIAAARRSRRPYSQRPAYPGAPAGGPDQGRPGEGGAYGPGGGGSGGSGSGGSGSGGGSGGSRGGGWGPVFIPRLPMGPPVRYPGPGSRGSRPPASGGSSPSTNRESAPNRPSQGGGGKSSGGGAGRGFPSGDSSPSGGSGPAGGGWPAGRSPFPGGFGGGGSRPGTGGGWSGGGGRSAGRSPFPGGFGGGGSRPGTGGGWSGGGGRSAGGGAGRSFKK